MNPARIKRRYILYTYIYIKQQHGIICEQLTEIPFLVASLGTEMLFPEKFTSKDCNGILSALPYLA